MSDTDDGGFVYSGSSGYREERGITRRDYYAGMAMQGIVSCMTLRRKDDGLVLDKMCKDAYAIADALIQEGKKNG